MTLPTDIHLDTSAYPAGEIQTDSASSLCVCHYTGGSTLGELLVLTPLQDSTGTLGAAASLLFAGLSGRHLAP